MGVFKEREGEIDILPIYEPHEAIFELHCKIGHEDIKACKDIRNMFPRKFKFSQIPTRLLSL